jgi:hypothetical protein
MNKRGHEWLRDSERFMHMTLSHSCVCCRPLLDGEPGLAKYVFTYTRQEPALMDVLTPFKLSLQVAPFILQIRRIAIPKL